MFKKKLVFTFILGVALTLCGCSKNDEPAVDCSLFTANPLLQAELLRTQRTDAYGTQGAQNSQASRNSQAMMTFADQKGFPLPSLGDELGDLRQLGDGFRSIVGHTTISNPSWTSVLTGVWSETSGVVNNVFTPFIFDEFPSVFNRLDENFDNQNDLLDNRWPFRNAD